MFQKPFSFEGRIRRTEYGISAIIYVFAITIINVIISASEGAAILGLVAIPLVWFMLAQGAKRCHDRGNSGWYILIPLYGFWMLFAEGELGTNQYGPNPKERNTQVQTMND